MKEVLAVRLQKGAEPAAQHFLPGISHKVQPGLIHLNDAPCLVQGLVSQRSLIKEQMEFFLTAAQVFFGELAGRAVADGRAALGETPFLRWDRNALQRHIPRGAL